MSKKKLISIILCISLLATTFIFASTGYADDIDKNGAYAFISDNSTLNIYSDAAMIDKTESTMAEYPWYSYKGAIEHIVIHDGVTKISDYAFCREDNVVDVVIPDSVTSIGIAAFAGDDMLKEITLSNNVTSIGANAFGFDSNMDSMNDFQCNCSAGSYAQSWCLQNYVQFNSPISNAYLETANIVEKGQQYLWSFVPKTDCEITFYSDCNFDTVGLIYDADNYTYSSNYTIMKSSAIAFADDIGDDVNFKITTTLKANKRYYLATRFKLTNRIGKIFINFDYTCVNHSYKCVSLEEDFMSGYKDSININCVNCDDEDYISFSDAVIEQYDFCDINNDGKVNAKDYAMMLKGQFN